MSAAVMMKESIENHDLFFSRIIAMISTDLYKHSNDSAASEEENSKFYKHKKVALGADEKKIASSKKRLLKYSVSNENTEGDADEDNEEEDETEENGSSTVEMTEDADERAASGHDIPARSSNNLDDLRLRLQNRIIGMKTLRTTTKEREPIATSDKIAAARKKAKNDHVKRKPSKAENTEDEENSYENENENDDVSMSGHSMGSSTSIPIEDYGDVQFSLITAKKTAEDIKNSSLSKPGTKMKRLKRMLETADKKRQRLDELKSAGSAGANRLKQEHWTDVLKSAQGEKTLNDTTKLRKAIKKREKKKETSAREWKGRLDTVESESKARIAKREENINVKKRGLAPTVGKDAETGGEKVGAGSGRPRLGFPKPGSQEGKGESGSGSGSSGGGKTAIRSVGGDKGKGGGGKGGGAGGKPGSKVRAGFEGKTSTGFLNKGGGGGGGKGGSGGGGKRK